jgi:hypothetical protein
MRALILVLCAAVAPAALSEPFADPQRAWAAQLQAEQQRRLERAQARCVENRGVDCDTEEGLQEWLLLDRSRAEAVLDRIAPPQLIVPPSASVGSAAPPAPARAAGQ